MAIAVTSYAQLHFVTFIIITREPGTTAPSLPTVSITPKNLEASLGASTSLTCSVSGPRLPMRFDWIHGTTPINASSGLVIESVSSKISRLLVPALKTEHSGIYTCRAVWPTRSFQEVAFVHVWGNGRRLCFIEMSSSSFPTSSSLWSLLLCGVVVLIPSAVLWQR